VPQYKSDHKHHCACRHQRLPPDLFERLRANPLISSIPGNLAEISRVIYGSPFGNADSQRLRILAQVSIPDASGHQRWRGQMPKYGLPRVMYDGVRMYVQQWLYLWSAPDRQIDPRDPTTLVRLCRDTLCISPEHHEYRPHTGLPTSPLAAVALWEKDHPRPLPGRPWKWDNSDPTGERCLAGHSYPTFKVYPGARRKNAYCQACERTERAWKAERAEVARQAEYRATGIPPRRPNEPAIHRTESYLPSPAPAPAEGVWDSPTLVEMLEAERNGTLDT
jgi:hypothetical protein